MCEKLRGYGTLLLIGSLGVVHEQEVVGLLISASLGPWMWSVSEEMIDGFVK